MNTSLTPTPAKPFAFGEAVAKVILFLFLGAVLLQGSAAKAQAFGMQNEPVGSWQTTLDIPAFGSQSLTVLLSFTADGIVIETDTPTAGPFFGSTVLANGHGAWKHHRRGPLTFVYVKEIYPGTGGQAVASGQCKVTGTAALSGDGKVLSVSNLTLVFTGTDGSVLTTATGTAQGSRIVVDEAEIN